VEVSTAQLVPETWELDGDDAAQTLRRARFRRLLADSITRFRSADGMSHARALALAVVLTVIPGIIAVVGFAGITGAGSVREAVTSLLTEVSPGPTGEILTAAISQGQDAEHHGAGPLVFGLLAMVFSGCTIFGQIERGANRIYGVEKDRPFKEKYAHAFLLFLAFFALAVALFVLFELRPSFLRNIHYSGPAWLWAVLRIAIGVAIVVPSFAVIFKVAPRRRQPAVSWLTVASGIAAFLWIVSTVALKLFWDRGKTFGQTYGPLAGVIGLVLWAYVIAIGLLYGLAFAAQLEAVRAGCAEPQDQEKVEESEPEAGEAKLAS
jgi:YihY family inner membrane protein